MMTRRQDARIRPGALSAAAVLVMVAALAWAAAPTAVPAGAPEAHQITLEVIAAACTHIDDGICLHYVDAATGTIGTAGPLIDIPAGDSVELTLVNRIAETIDAVPGDAATKARLASSPVSFHVHGTAISAAEDGILGAPGTQLVRSVAEPGGSFTTHFRAAFAGTWHYHDHVLGPDGAEGAARGLYGGLIVRPAFHGPPDAVFDLRLLNEGPNGGQPFVAPDLPAGSSFEVMVATLGDFFYEVTLVGPDRVLWTYETGPGTSDRIRVDEATPGVYTWTVANTLSLEEWQGTIEVSA